MASQPIYQFYSELVDYEPKIWRRFQVPRTITMAKLCYIVMTMYEMQASHQFCLNRPVYEEYITRYELPDEEGVPLPMENEDVQDATNAILAWKHMFPGDTLTMEYDYGDGWEVAITLEDIIEDKDLPARELPRVLEGAGYGIIEDCGGTGGLENLAKAFHKKKGKEYEEYRAWLGQDDLDLSAFDKDDTNFRLKKIPRIYKNIYEYGLEPTQQAIDLIERNYYREK